MIDIPEIKTMLREAMDKGDMDAFLAGMRLLREYHPDTFQALMVEMEKMMNEPGGRLQ